MPIIPMSQKIIEMEEVASEFCDEYEFNFIQDMYRKVMNGRFSEKYLTNNQRKLLDKLWEKVCASDL